MFMEGLCVLIEREYKPGKLFLPQKKKKSRCQALGGGGMGWGRLSQPEKREGYWKTASVSGIVTGDVPVSYWPVFSLFLVTLPEVFANGNSSYGYYFTHGNRKRKRRIVREEWSVFLPERRWFRVYSWVVFTKT